MDYEQFKADYWDFETVNNNPIFKYTVKQIVEKYNYKSANKLYADIKERKLYKFWTHCKYCKKFEFITRRSDVGKEDSLCDCIGFCTMCSEEPIKIFSPNGVCNLCFYEWCSNENKKRKEFESNCKIENFTPDEIQMLSVFMHFYDDIMKDGEIRFDELSFKLKCPIEKAKNLWKFVIEKGGICIEWVNENLYFTGLNTNLEIPDYKPKFDYKMIKSDLAVKTFRELSSLFPYVFVDAPFAAFIDIKQLDRILPSDEIKSLFTKRLDFICCDDEFNVVLLAEYNGRHHFYSDNRLKDSRIFKKKVSDLLGICFIEFNSPSQICSKLERFRG